MQSKKDIQYHDVIKNMEDNTNESRNQANSKINLDMLS